MINRDRLFTTFLELCSIDSEPTCERLMADRLTAQLTALGCIVMFRLSRNWTFRPLDLRVSQLPLNA